MERITREWVRRQLPRRRSDGHKGTFGKVYVLGGAVGYTGAPGYAPQAGGRFRVPNQRFHPQAPEATCRLLREQLLG